MGAYGDGSPAGSKTREQAIKDKYNQSRTNNSGRTPKQGSKKS